MKYLHTFESHYSNISKNIGWEGGSSSIPRKEDVKKWIQEAEQGNSEAFSKLFSIVRYDQPKNKLEVEIVNLAFEGWKNTKKLFENNLSEIENDNLYQDGSTREQNGLLSKMRILFDSESITTWEYRIFLKIIREYARIHDLYFDEEKEQLFKQN